MSLPPSARSSISCLAAMGNKQFDDPAIYKVARLIWNKFAGKFNRNSTFTNIDARSGFSSGFLQSILRGFELDTIRARWKFEIARQDVELGGSSTPETDRFPRLLPRGLLASLTRHCLRVLFLRKFKDICEIRTKRRNW